MDLKSRLNQDLKEALKAKDEVKLRTVRMLLTAIKNFEVEKMTLATDEDILQIMSKEIKKRQEAIEMYEKGGRQDLAQAERQEIEVIQSYMPKQLSEEEIKEIAKKVISELNLKGPKDVGVAMKAIMPQVKGRADGKLVNKIVSELLSGS
ncbi:aspartyl-tRNA amidotransferase subunit B [Pseudothermotoga hypogea DSM 11164 = NBRC 106472]|uniref:Aspartyl-tRNA amidotransferase subunit B n=2 Tax=Pseudothermotoga hypogea TaxID=57487 RepID=A0A0X1KQK5_9THEM|nr:MULTISPECIES: GatB/YqeY domain-containing protein [Pseudothermotoga]AJC73587.1 aspartyl-tRNA amidotransferase subunit B [Pseudothermotoga hypogea DSM 11164 = NBRC 106472]MDI6863739.1 GatB/YqeY domain-containing protein [Pseudothermotoga sp.]